MVGIEAPHEIVVERIDQTEKDANRNGDSEHGRDWTDVSAALNEIGGNMQSRARCDNRSDDQDLAVPPDKGAVAVTVKYLR